MESFLTAAPASLVASAHIHGAWIQAWQRVNGQDHKLEWQLRRNIPGNQRLLLFPAVTSLPSCRKARCVTTAIPSVETVAKLRWLAGERSISGMDFHGYAMYKFPTEAGER